MSKEQIESIEARTERLTARERYAYEYWCRSEQPGVAPAFGASMFALFLNGKSCEEIHRLNPGLTLGQVVSARVQGEWDRRRDEYAQDLLDRAAERLEQSTLASADFLQDMLAVARKKHGDALKRYLQDGNEAHLKDTMTVDSIDAFKKVVEALQKLTGQERQQTVRVIKTEAPAAAQVPAAQGLRLLAGGK